MCNKRVVYILSSILIGLVVLIIVLLTKESSQKIIYGEFVPPEFDIKAEKGMPDTDDKSFNRLHQDGIPYSLHICGEVAIYDNRFSDIYFTNDESNNAWLKLRIFDSEDKIVAETGIIRPGEYIKTIEFNRDMSANEKVRLKVMSYEPGTYHSLGSIVLSSSIKDR